MEVQKSHTFFESLKIRVDQFFSNLQITSGDVIEWVSYFGVGFVFGLLLKRYGKYIISCLLVLTLFLATLHYFDFIVINQEKIKTMFGFHASETFETILNVLLLQVKIHILDVGVLSLGCLLGFKFG